MTVKASSVASFVEELRKITTDTSEPRKIIGRLRPAVRALALDRAWVEPRHYECDAGQGFGAHLLHEEPDHTLAVFAASWLPGRGAPPHDHGTWAVVAGVDGDEKNIFWKRIDDGSRPGYAELRKEGEKVFGAGDVVSFLPGAIHSVVNETDRVSLSLHVYGKHLNYTGRSQFDPDRKIELPFIVRVQ